MAYVPNRVLNELSSQTFQDLLKKKDIKKTDEIMFKVIENYRKFLTILLNFCFIYEF